MKHPKPKFTDSKATKIQQATKKITVSKPTEKHSAMKSSAIYLPDTLEKYSKKPHYDSRVSKKPDYNIQKSRRYTSYTSEKYNFRVSEKQLMTMRRKETLRKKLAGKRSGTRSTARKKSPQEERSGTRSTARRRSCTRSAARKRSRQEERSRQSLSNIPNSSGSLGITPRSRSSSCSPRSLAITAETPDSTTCPSSPLFNRYFAFLHFEQCSNSGSPISHSSRTYSPNPRPSGAMPASHRRPHGNAGSMRSTSYSPNPRPRSAMPAPTRRRRGIHALPNRLNSPPNVHEERSSSNNMLRRLSNTEHTEHPNMLRRLSNTLSHILNRSSSLGIIPRPRSSSLPRSLPTTVEILTPRSDKYNKTRDSTIRPSSALLTSSSPNPRPRNAMPAPKRRHRGIHAPFNSHPNVYEERSGSFRSTSYSPNTRPRGTMSAPNKRPRSNSYTSARSHQKSLSNSSTQAHVLS